MLALYLACLGFGAVLLGVSVMLGDKDADKDFDKSFDKDFEVGGAPDADADAEADADGGEAEGFAKGGDGALAAGQMWLPFLSTRFWTFGVTAFGFTGTALTFADLNWLLVFALAALFGAGSGTAAAWFFRALGTESVSGETRLDRMVGEEARVVLPIGPGQRGTIAWMGPTGRVEMIATTLDAHVIPPGSTVIVAGVKDGVADVSALPGDPETRAAKARERSTSKQPG